ncbi:hypothetical protein DVH24_008337, partial [Malus domestica]
DRLSESQFDQVLNDELSQIIDVLLNWFVQLNVIFAPTRWAVFSCPKSPRPFLSRLLRDLVYFLAVLINFLPTSNCSLIFSSLSQIICAKSVSLFLVAGKKFGCYKFLAFKIPHSLRILFLFWIYQNQFFCVRGLQSWKEKKVKYTNELESKVTIFRISYPGKPRLPDEFFGFHIWHLCFVQIWGADSWVIENFASDIISSAAIKSVNRFPSLQGGCWVEFGYTDNAVVYHTKVFFLSFCPIFGILVTKSVFSIVINPSVTKQAIRLAFVVIGLDSCKFVSLRKREFLKGILPKANKSIPQKSGRVNSKFESFLGSKVSSLKLGKVLDRERVSDLKMKRLFFLELVLIGC